MDFDWSVILPLGSALILGGFVGFERELVGKAAGFRTHSIVSVGAALIMMISIMMFESFKGQGAVSDPSRIAAQVVSGIGFLGAGAIIRSGVSVVGITTAATLWVCAGIGLACGAGYYNIAIITTLLVILVLIVFRYLDQYISSKKSSENGI